jgi:hypothetical protein
LSTDTIPFDRIAAEAYQIHFWRTVVTIFAGVFFAVGWSVAKVWLLVAFAAAAVKVGFQQGTKKPTPPRA